MATINAIDISTLYWTKGYKYKSAEDFTARLPIKLDKNIRSNSGLVMLSKDGLLAIKQGWACDGASGLTIDTKSSMRGAFIHDALYLLMREGHLSLDHRELADRILKDVCILDEMFPCRAKTWYVAVQRHGLDSAAKKRKVYSAP